MTRRCGVPRPKPIFRISTDLGNWKEQTPPFARKLGDEKRYILSLVRAIQIDYWEL